VKANPAIRFIIAPHEIDETNLQDVKKEFPTSVFYSQLVQQNSEDAIYEADPAVNVLIIDNVGMLSRLYHYANITYVGGGFGVEGVHNVLEAAVYGKPVLFGPEYEKYAEATDLVEKGAAIPIANALELEQVLTELWNDEELLKNKGATARKYVYEHVGASKKILDFIQENRLLTN
jgi:3-deoxy-D-manno-octulosonic-acid transferase